MSTLINLATNTIASAGLFGILTNGVAVLWVALLLILIIEKVLLDANGQRTSVKRTIAFDIAIWPMLLGLVVIVFLRMAQVLQK